MRLFNTINSLAGENKLEDATAERVFDKWWPELEADVDNVLKGHTANKNEKKIRQDRELLEEILLLLRAAENVQWIAAYDESWRTSKWLISISTRLAPS
jgi:hypothetical protein